MAGGVGVAAPVCRFWTDWQVPGRLQGRCDGNTAFLRSMHAKALHAKALALQLLHLASASSAPHPDTLHLSQCLSPFNQLPLVTQLTLAAQGATLPSVCFNGTANLCTNKIDLNVTFGDSTTQIATGDGTNLTADGWVAVPEATFPGPFCNSPAIRLRNAVISVSGILACLDVKLSCLPPPNRSLSLPCLNIGDDTNRATDKCGCIQHPECGWGVRDHQPKQSIPCARAALTLPL